MPELPEVETIKLELQKLIKNKKIKSVEIRLAKEVKNPEPGFLKGVVDAKVTGIKRRAKTLIIDLDNGYHLVFHLKLTGQLIYQGHQREFVRDQGISAAAGHHIRPDWQELPSKYTHVIFNFADGACLFFNDLRQFGWVKLVGNEELERMNAGFGPEPLAQDFSFEKFKELFSKKRSAPIKPLLMDQSFLAGIGNIYAQEICFCAGILSTRPANKISEDELNKLYNCLKKILEFAVSKKGSSVEYYVDAFGKKGGMAPYLKVYGRAGEKCQQCGSIIKSIKQGSRTTCYCPKCQN